MRPSYSLDELLPHRAPMQLIDEVVDVDAETRTITTAVTVREEWSDSCVAIEFMAQTAAALVGYVDRVENADRPARPGFLLGTRRMTLDIDRFAVGKRYLVTAHNEFADSDAASFSCKVMEEDGRVVASATLNAYRPSDINEFLKGQNA